MKATYVDHMGTDLSVVNAARVSFAKQGDWEEYDLLTYPPKPAKKLKERDAKLINYLARHNHWTPFGHTSVTIHCKAPIFVARQLGKHQVGLVWNEVSRRYVDDLPEFYRPESWRLRAEDKKQGSDETKTAGFIKVWSDKPITVETDPVVGDVYEHCLSIYELLLENDICPEQARMVLPQSMYTEWYWTGSIAAFSRICKLRLDPHTQKETRDIAADISGIIQPLFPVSWEALLASDVG